ncbi:MAG: hypothetical protein HY282_12285 [Nitrospirae bacterium]|nr:hypothetical protein [Candidatus Manganitrophaceae bacterium]
MTEAQEAYLFGFLHAARLPGEQTIRHRDKEVLEEAARLLALACESRKIPHRQLHHPERPLHGTKTETRLTLPDPLASEIEITLPALFKKYRLRQSDLERGILEGCGTLCYKKSTRGIGISFTAADREWLAALRDEIQRHHASEPIETTVEGRHWFSIQDTESRSYADWLYGDPAAPHSPARRRKLERVLGQLQKSDR